MASEGGVTSFLARNQKAIVVGTAAVVAVAGTVYYLSQSGPSSSPSSTSADAAVKRARKKRARGKGSKKGAASEDDSADTPPRDSVADGVEQQKAKDDDPTNLSSTDISLLDPDARQAAALALKGKGNKLYSAKKFKEAVTCYTKAIECEEQAVFYSNRAACFTALGELPRVVEDCTDALRLDPTYIKALNRRATALENLGGEDNLFKSLCDFTAAAILNGFTDDAAQVPVERVMKRLASEKASAIFAAREPRLPSPTFIKAYFEAFRPKPRPAMPENPSTGDNTLSLALDATAARNYVHALSLFNEAIEQGLSTPELEANALSMRATFRFIMGLSKEALVDLDKAHELENCKNPTTYVKRASVHMELGNAADAMKDFETALEVDPNDADAYYHRGQVYFIMGEWDKAIDSYKSSSDRDPTFIFSHIQSFVAQYKQGPPAKALSKFKAFVRTHEDTAEANNYLGELLLDQQKYEDAVSRFEKAIELEKNSRPRNVLPMINLALAHFQWHGTDFSKPEQLCRDAIAIDPQCDVGVGTLAQLLLQQNKIREAIEWFQRSAELARTEPELANAITYESATRAQIAFVETYPEHAARLGLSTAVGA